MIDPAQINCVIFDFDGTLCSGRYFEPLGSAALEAIGELMFGKNSAHWADPWMSGELSSREIARYLSRRLDCSAEAILSALRRGSANMTFNREVHRFALNQRGRDRKTALVTANMDVFTEVVVPAHDLDRLFDVVPNTADRGTLDKRVLWRDAIDTFGTEYTFASTLLIEDNPGMVELFEALGGYAYRYQGDKALHDWLKSTGFASQLEGNGLEAQA